jgi:glycosyltransferase involved in cell wall biosynthesis
MVAALGLRQRIARVNLSPGAASGGGLTAPVYHVRRLGRVAGAMAKAGIWRLAGGRVLYQPCSGGFGVVYNLGLAAVARAVGLRNVLHHHSFRYIDRRFAPMAWLVRVAGRAATHIFLCEEMQARFEAVYGSVSGVVLPNDVFIDRAEAPAPAGSRDGPLRIGLLSNLTAEKGLFEFLDLLRAASAEGLAEGVLAGPATGDDARAIGEAQQALGAALDYRGAVHGEEKARFFADIDVFIFPTNYANEAQPLVICEAMAAARPVLAWNRGCIAGQLGEALPPLDRDAPFTPWALDHLRRFAADRAALAEIGKANAARAAQKAAEGAEALRRLATAP